MAEFDPKKLGEEADRKIAQLAQQKADAVNASDSDEQPSADITGAIPQDEGVPSQPPTESAVQPQQKQTIERSEELTLLKEQVRASEQRWKVLQGMINKKDEELDKMRELFAHLSAAQAPGNQDQGQQVQEALLSSAEVDEYGEKYIDMVRRAGREGARMELAALMHGVEERFKVLEQAVGGVQTSSAQTAQSAFLAELERLVPTYKQLNTDPGFAQWLDQIDPATGVSKKDLLTHAVRAMDVTRTAWFFNTYAQAIAPTTPVDIADAPIIPSKESLVAPGRRQAAVTPQQASGKRTWTRNNITQLYELRRQGRVSAKEFNDLEKDLFLAQTEGRVSA